MKPSVILEFDHKKPSKVAVKQHMFCSAVRIAVQKIKHHLSTRFEFAEEWPLHFFEEEIRNLKKAGRTLAVFSN